MDCAGLCCLLHHTMLENDESPDRIGQGFRVGLKRAACNMTTTISLIMQSVQAFAAVIDLFID